MALTAAPPARADRRRGPVLAALLTASAFGPYVVGGFRTEQLAVYGVAAMLTVGACWTRVRPGRAGILVVGLLGVQLLIAGVGAADPPQNTTHFPFGSAAAGLDNLLLPIAVIGIVWMLHAMGGDRIGMIRAVCAVTVGAMLINTAMAVQAAAGAGPNLASWQGPEGGGESVASLAEQLGRYSGLFNQPAEAGLMYSLALLSAVYLFRRRAVLLALSAITLAVGGVLTVSKTFLFVGLPVGVWHILRTSGGRQRRVAAILLTFLGLWEAVRSGLTPRWQGVDFLMRLLPDASSGRGAVDLYTAGRLGGESTLAQVTDDVLRGSPFSGFGAGGLSVPYDNGWVEVLVVAGMIGVVVFTVVLVVLALAALRGSSWPRGSAERRLAAGVVCTVIGAAVGLPSLTANRCATVVWLLLGLLLLSRGRELRRPTHGLSDGVDAASAAARDGACRAEDEGLEEPPRPVHPAMPARATVSHRGSTSPFRRRMSVHASPPR